LKIDLASSSITLPNGATAQFPIEGFARYCLMNGVDELGFLLKQAPAIERYEAAHPAL
jgi:3-isopropylmalate/(R)-2-methylmalate dehydratase small subunit